MEILSSCGLADWLTAIGTVGAVIISLWLALRVERERLAFSLDIRSSELNILVFNQSARPLVLREAEFEIGRFRPSTEDSIEVILGGRGLPKTLGPSEYFTHNYTLNYTPSYLPDRIYNMRKERLPWNRKLYFTATTGSGKRFRYPIPRRLLPQLVRKGS